MNKFLIFIILLFNLNTNIFANPNIQGRTGILVDFHSNQTLFELKPDR